MSFCVQNFTFTSLVHGTFAFCMVCLSSRYTWLHVSVWVLIWLLMPDCNDIFPLSCNTFKALNRHMRSNEINNWIMSIHSSPLSSQACRGGSMCQIFIFDFCLCQHPETIVDLKLFSLFADAANSRTDRTVAKGILMLFFFIFTLFLFSLLNIADFF